MPTEADTCRKFVVPKLQAAGWDNEPYSIAERRTITDGRIVPVGKTYTAVNFVYRLIKLAGARRVLFLVDRGNLGDQTLKEFQQFVTPDDGRKFTELYNVQHLQSAQLDRVSRVCISTIQRLYSMLRGEEIDPEIDERSGYELGDTAAQASRLWGQRGVP